MIKTLMAPQLALTSHQQYIDRREWTGLNLLAFSEHGLVAAGDVRMNVTVRRGDATLFDRNFTSENTKARATDRLRTVGFSPGGSRLYVAGGDTLHAIDWETGQETWRYTPPKAFGFLVILPTALAISAGGNVAASFENGTTIVWSEVGEVKARWRDADLPRSMAFLDDGQLVGADAFALAVWDPRSGIKSFRRGLRDRVYAMATDGKSLVVTRALSAVTFWSLEAGEVAATIPAPTGLPLVAISPKRWLVALGAEYAVELVDYDGRSVGRIEIPETRVLSLAFSADGGTLAVGGADEQLRFFPVG